MTDLPPASQRFIDEVPIRLVQSGVRTVIELTAYPRKSSGRHQHAGIAAGELDTSVRGKPSYTRTVQPLPLNHRAELEQFLGAILDRLFAAAETPAARETAAD